MPFLRKLLLIPKAVRQLGRGPLLLYVRYQIKLRSGILRMQTPRGARKNIGDFELREVIRPANKEKIKELLGKRVDELFAEADEIFNGQVRLFGTASRKLELSLAGQLEHWTHYHSQMPDGTDIKPIWEAGRFGWATVLARAYWLSGEERFAEGFWKFTEQFLADNPPNKGPHWSSAQEVALRLISLAFWYSLVADSVASTSERKQRLVQSVIAHAERIPPTLDYARAQNNNHLLSEALGLCTAAALLPDHPKATRWNELGRKYFFEGIESQIHEDGSYAQHSANYHRLMLQLSLWANKLLKEMPLPVATKLARSTDWLLTLLDEESGRVPNLGPNDGAYILPLSVQAFEDYRPALQAASLAFRGGSALANGIWDEMALWFGIDPAGQRRDIENGPIRIEGKNSWAYLRAAQFQERPGHADQLHLDLWWRGLNIAQDAGSYLYTAPQPWDNALTSARVHNTLTVSGREPMTRAGRFLWLDWAQGKVVSAKKTDLEN
ncbi:MAG: heparinase II/III family protein [Anaerolineales bacterium]